MASSPDIRLVCFDLGGVVIRICRSWDEARLAAGVSERAPLKPELLLAFESWSQRLQLGQVKESEVSCGVAAASGGAYSVDDIDRIQAAILREPYEGVAELARELKRKRVRTGVLSNTSLGHWERMTELEAVRELDERFLSFRLGLVKPSPEIYAAVERESGLDGEAIAFFDDTLANVRAAKARGWQAELIDFDRPTDPQMREALVAWGILPCAA